MSHARHHKTLFFIYLHFEMKPSQKSDLMEMRSRREGGLKPVVPFAPIALPPTPTAVRSESNALDDWRHHNHSRSRWARRNRTEPSRTRLRVEPINSRGPTHKAPIPPNPRGRNRAARRGVCSSSPLLASSQPCRLSPLLVRSAKQILARNRAAPPDPRAPSIYRRAHAIASLVAVGALCLLPLPPRARTHLPPL